MGDVVVVHAGEDPPARWQASVFLAGPMPRDPSLPSWRPEAISELTTAWTGPGTLAVFTPEARDRHQPRPGYVSQLWEEQWMAVADVMLFWVPRNTTTMPGLNTNIEFGRNESSGRLVLGLPPEAVSVHYLRRAAETHGAPVRTTLRETTQATINMINGGADRAGPDRDVPLLIWRTDAFQTWRANLNGELQGARLLWAWSPASDFRLRAWTMRVRYIREGSHADELLMAGPATTALLASPLSSTGLSAEQ